MASEARDRPFADLPAALVQEVLDRTEGISQALLADFEQNRVRRDEWRDRMRQTGILRHESDLPYVPIPTTCGVDGSYAVERLLAADLVAAAAVAVEGLTPPSETRHWPEPRHEVLIERETHDPDTGTIARAIMMGKELTLAARAPHEVVFVDGSLTTPLIYFNQALNQVGESRHLQVTTFLIGHMKGYLEAYREVLASSRSDHCWVAVPKYTTRREVGQKVGWPETYDDRGMLTTVLAPGEFTQPLPLKQPDQPWHLNLGPIRDEDREGAESAARDIYGPRGKDGLLGEVHVLHYRPYPWLPALRLETSRTVAQTPGRLASLIHGVKHQCGAASMMEPYPLYMADRMVKHLWRALPTFRQVTSQRIAETYQGDIGEVYLSLHGYRTDSGA